MRGQNRVNFWKVKFLKDVLIKKWTLLNKKRFSQFFFAKMHFWTKIYSIVNWQPRSVLVTLNNECCGSPRVEKGLLIDHRAGRFLDVAVNRRLIEPLRRGASQSLPITIEESSMLTACKTKPDEFRSCNLVIAKHN